jgi:ABC-type transporter Mla subunit MlaD
MTADNVQAKATKMADLVKAAERDLNQAASVAKQLKSKSREAKRKAKQAKKTAKQAAKAARAARKAVEDARDVYKKATARVAKARAKAAKEHEQIVTPTKKSGEARSARRKDHPRKRTRRRVWEVGEDAVDTQVAELPELGAEVAAIGG